MKFGIRTPSLKNRIAARTSWKRVVRHNLGFKAPRGWGWLTNPKKAAYNRVYSRTTVDAFALLGGPSRRRRTKGSGGSGVAVALVVLSVLWAIVTSQAFKIVLFVGLLVGPMAIIAVRASSRRRSKLEQAEAEAMLVRRRADLSARFDGKAVERILAHEVWEGASAEMLIEALGPPDKINERILKTKTKHTYCYQPLPRKRYALKVHLENGVVVGWDRL